MDTERRLVTLSDGRDIDARAHLLAGEGHLTMTVSALGRVLDDLLDLAGPS